MRTRDPRQRFETDGKSAVSQERLVILLYERLERDLAEARRAVASGDTHTRHRCLVHAQLIIEELSYAVRPELWEGGDGLLALYDYLLGLLVRANIEASTLAIDEAAHFVSDLTEAWRGAYLTLTPEASPA